MAIRAWERRSISWPASDIPSVPEVKFTSLDFKRADIDGTFEGYASLFNREDLGRDVVLPGAFRESLAQRGARGIKLLYQHDANQPIGVWTALQEDSRGLYAQGRLMRDVAKAREVMALMRAGALDGLSIGFKTVRARRDRVTGVRRLEKVSFLTLNEKRAAVGYAPLDDPPPAPTTESEQSSVVRKLVLPKTGRYRPDQARAPAGTPEGGE